MFGEFIYEPYLTLINETIQIAGFYKSTDMFAPPITVEGDLDSGKFTREEPVE